MAPDTTPGNNTTATPSTAPRVSQSEAAKICGCSTATIRRARHSGLLPGAVPEGKGWLIPIPELVSAGLLDNPERAARATQRHQARDIETTHVRDIATQAELDALRAKLAEVEKRAAVAEALANEREKSLDDLRTSMRLLTAAHNEENTVVEKVSTVAPEPAPSSQVTAVPTPRKRFGFFGRA